MNKTCETCAYNIRGVKSICGLISKFGEKRITDSTPACEHYEFMPRHLFQKAMRCASLSRKGNPTFFSRIIFDKKYLDDMARWHKEEPERDAFVLAKHIDIVFLDNARAIRDEQQSLKVALEYLVLVFCKHLEIGDFPNALLAGAQITGTLIRALNEEGNLKKEEED